MNKCAISLLLALLLISCGGGKPTLSQVDAAVLSKLDVSQTLYQASNHEITLTATANAAATAYCFKTGAGQPVASDACFQSSNQKVIQLPGTLPAHYVWVKNAANVVNVKSLSGPCSAQGYAASDKSQLPTVCMMTSLGEMVLELEDQRAPITAQNFLKYVNAGFYSNTIFHRYNQTFIQGGGGESLQNKQLVNKAPLYAPIVLEKPSITGVYNTVHAIAMARTTDPNSATSGFFINLINNTSWNSDTNAYAAFGRVVSGQEVALAISRLSGTSASDATLTPVSPAWVLWAVQLK